MALRADAARSCRSGGVYTGAEDFSARCGSPQVLVFCGCVVCLSNELNCLFEICGRRCLHRD